MTYSSVTEILPGLWLGDTSVAHDDIFLRNKEIQFVINCSDEANNSSIQIKHRLQLPLKYTANDCLILCRAIDEYTNLIKNNINSYNILISGHQSAPVITVTYLIKYGLLDVEQAIKCLESKRLGTADQLAIYVPLLKVYQKLLKR